MIPISAVLLGIVHLVVCQSRECPDYRAPSQLAAVTVWTRTTNRSVIYRISDEDLTDEGYQRGSIDRDDVVVLLARSPGSCTVGPCSLQLSTNIRESDGAVSHQENVLGTPDGFDDIHSSFYCVRRFGDCGAQRPVYRYTRGSGSTLEYAYSLDPMAIFPGYSAEAKILCYGWSDNGSVVRPLSKDKSCLPINSIPNGKITYSTPASSFYSVGTTATVVCDEGFVGGGQSAVLCVKNGWYPSSGLGYCVRQNSSHLNTGSALVSSASLECAALGSIQNGQLIYSSLATGGRFPQGTRVTVFCNIGYNVIGSIDAVCESGRWSRKLAVCQSSFDTKCPALTTPFRGRIVYSSMAPYTPSTTATLLCEPGLAVSGASILACTEEGWSPRSGFGECRTGINGIGCPAVNVAAATVTYIQSNPAIPYSSGSTVFVMCNLGYTPQGSMSAICQNGAWTPPIGTCSGSAQSGSSNSIVGGVNSGSTGNTCTAMNSPMNGYVTYTPTGSFGSYPAGTTASLSCYLGYTVSGTMTSTCSGGTWIPATLGTCNAGLGGLGGSNSILTCPNLSVVNGMVFYSTGSSADATKQDGAVATLTCNLGYNPVGSTTATCRNGIWSPTLGTCSSTMGGGSTSGQTCTTLFPPFGGTISYSSGSTMGPFNSGTTATLQCNSGTPQGTTFTSCINGQWTPPTLGTCSSTGTGSSTCPAMVAPFGGTLSYSSGGTFGPYNSGTTVSLTCNSGFPTGAAMAICSNGAWNPSTLGTCSTTGTGSGSTCPAMMTPLGGTLSYSSGGTFPPFSSGTSVTLTCNSGFPSGPSFATCSNGVWTPSTLGTCSSSGIGGSTGSTCSAMMTPLGATLSYSSGSMFGPFNSGTTVTMTCTNGSPLGSTTSTCTNGQWFPPSLGTCNSIIGGNTGSTCPALIAPSGGTITMSNGGSSFSPATQGTIATLNCPSGVQGTTSAVCSNGAWSPPTLGTCVGFLGTGSGGTNSCQTMTTPTGAYLSYSNLGFFPPFPSGTTVTARCFSGATISGASTSTCSNGQWQPSVLGTCDSATGGSTCPSAQVTGGTVNYSDGPFSFMHPTGSTATLVCNSGTPQGSTSSTCQNGQWTPALGSCSGTGSGIGSGTSCTLPPPSPLGATLSYSTGSMFGPWTPGTTATMTCPMGQTVIGAATVTCSNGVWTSLGTCSSAGNSSTTLAPTSNATSAPCFFGLVAPVNGSITYSDPTPPYSKGSTAILSCDEGYTVAGPSNSTCTDGSFTAIGTCRKDPT